MVEAEKAQYEIIYAPLDPNIEFDLEAANSFIDKHYGTDYGFPISTTGLIDFAYYNLPCRRNSNFPEDQKNICLEPELVEILFT